VMNSEFTVIEKISFSSDLSNLTKVESLVDVVCEELNLDGEMFGNVLIAVTEAVNNSIIHGNKFSNSKNVNVEVGLREDTFVFCVSDSGDGFDFTNLPDPTAPENIEKENGRGIFLIKNLADELEYSDNGRVASIFFNRIHD